MNNNKSNLHFTSIKSKRGFKTPRAGNFETRTLVARRRERFRVYLADFLVAELPQKRGCFNTQEFVSASKAKSFEPDQKIVSVQNRIHLLSTLELIVQKHSFLRIRVQNTCFCGRDMFKLSKPTFNVPNGNLRPIQTNIYYITEIPRGNFKVV